MSSTVTLLSLRLSVPVTVTTASTVNLSVRVATLVTTPAVGPGHSRITVPVVVTVTIVSGHVTDNDHQQTDPKLLLIFFQYLILLFRIIPDGSFNFFSTILARLFTHN